MNDKTIPSAYKMDKFVKKMEGVIFEPTSGIVEMDIENEGLDEFPLDVKVSSEVYSDERFEVLKKLDDAGKPMRIDDPKLMGAQISDTYEGHIILMKKKWTKIWEILATNWL